MNARCPHLTVVLLLSGVLALSVHAQEQPEAQSLPDPTYYKPLRFETVTQADGLSQTTVAAILQDRQGYLWFGVEGGLNRYDGYDFKVYKSNVRDTTALTANVSTLYEDRSGTLWVGTNDGLNRFNRETETFTRLPADLDDATSFGGRITSIHEDGAGALWVGIDNRGLRRLDLETGALTAYWHDPEDATSLSHDAVLAVHEDQAGRLWVGTFNGLDVWDRESDTFTRVLQPGPENDPPKAVLCIREDPSLPDVLWLCTPDGLLAFDVNAGSFTRYLGASRDGRPVPVIGLAPDPDSPHVLWVATGGENSRFGVGDGLVRFDTRTGEHRRFRHNPSDPQSLPTNHLLSIYTDRSGIVWAGVTKTGLVRFDPSADGFIHYRHVPGDPESLPAGSVWSLAEDLEGRLWAVVSVGDARGVGILARIDRQSGRVKTFVHDPDDPSSIRSESLFGIFVDTRGWVWVGVLGGGLERLDPETDRVRHYRHDPDDPNSMPPATIRFVQEDSYGHLWFSSRDGSGVRRLDPISGTVSSYRHDPEDATSLSGDGVEIVGVRASRSGTVWVGTENGLNRYDAATETPGSGPGQGFTRYYRVPGDTTGLNAVHWLYEAPDSRLWGVTSDGPYNALFRFDPATGAWETFPQDLENPNSFFLPDPMNGELYVRAQEPDVLWFAHIIGLQRIDARTGQVRHFTEADGFADPVSYHLREDAAGRFWISSNGGLTVYDPAADEVVHTYDQADGLQANEFNWGSAFQSPRTGEMFFGGINGITAFFPDRVLDNPVPPSVSLTDFRLFNEHVRPGPDAPLDKPVAMADEIRLAHSQKSIAFDYVGLHFQNPKKNRYRFQLEGFDDGWIEAGTQRTAAYTNLDPGDYTFRVTAANSDGVWTDTPASIRVVVAPPWWRTVWAYLLYGLLFVAGVVAVDRVQRRRLLRKERERTAIAEAELRAEAAEADARALEADNRRKQHVELLSEIGKEITASLDIETIFDRLYEHVNALMDADSFGVGLYHAERGEIDYRLAIEQGTRYTPYTRDMSDTNQFPVWCIAHRAPVFINDVAAEYSRYIDHYDDTRQALEDGSLSDAPQSLIYLPLEAQDRVLGVITVQSFETDAYTEHDLNVLKTLAAYTSIALDNADAYRQLGSTLANLKSTQDQLVQQEKLASLGQVTAGIAHEIKNPLNFVNNFAELNEELAQELADELTAQKDQRVADVLDGIVEIVGGLKTNARQIAKHGKRADAIVKTMMEHALSTSGERYHVELNPFVEEYVGLSYHGMQAQRPDLDVTIERAFEANAGNVEMGPQEMGRVLLNLLNNAFEAVHEHALTVNGAYSPKVRVSTRRVDDRVEVRIGDNGPGIPNDFREKIFEPFFTTKPTGSGTGLGLSLSYDIVTQGHGGTLTVEDTTGGGATFVVTLPVSQGESDSPT